MAQQFQAQFVGRGESIDYTPGADVAAGAVVVQGSLAGFAQGPLPANVLGALGVRGIYRLVKVNGAISAGAACYWDLNGDPQGGTAGTGAVTTTPTGNIFLGFAVKAAGITDEIVYVNSLGMLASLQHALSAAIADPGNAGAIPVTQSGRVAIVTAGAETRTLAAPTFAGQELLIYGKTLVGACTITCATTVNEGGDNTITLTNAGESVRLIAVEEGANLRWRCPVADPATILSTV